MTKASNGRLFLDAGGGNYQAQHFLQDQLTYNSTADLFTFKDTAGNRIVFTGFDSKWGSNGRGQMERFIDAGGNETAVTERTADGKPQELQRSSTVGGTTVTESYLLSYLTSGGNAGKVGSVTLRRQTNGGAWSTVRSVEYAYYEGGDANGNPGDLKLVTLKDANGATIDQEYYRYYTSGGSGGYQGGMKYRFGAASFARLQAAFPGPVVTPFNATDAQVAPYADVSTTYNGIRQVTARAVQGDGCSSCSGGVGTYTYNLALCY